MKSDRQLNHTLEMQTKMPARGIIAGLAARYRAPDVFENFMCVEKVGAVEQIDTSVDVSV
jgi:hypothetical protein